MTSRLFTIVFLPFALAGCVHQWPREAHGGMAERSPSSNPSLQSSAEWVEFLMRTPGDLPPSDIAIANDDLVRARREWEAGLTSDAEESHVSALVRLGGVPPLKAGGPVCLKQPCTGVQ